LKRGVLDDDGLSVYDHFSGGGIGFWKHWARLWRKKFYGLRFFKSTKERDDTGESPLKNMAGKAVLTLALLLKRPILTGLFGVQTLRNEGKIRRGEVRRMAWGEPKSLYM